METIVEFYNKNIKSLFEPNAKPQKEKSMEDIIRDIHNEFFTETDRIKERAAIVKKKKDSFAYNGMQELIAKSDRLEKQGFTQSEEVKMLDTKISYLELEKKQLEGNLASIEANEYFSFKYPMYKFIDRQGIDRICGKYGLVFGDVENFTGKVPEENLKHIEQFKINENDECYWFRYEWWSFHLIKSHFNEYCNKERFEEIQTTTIQGKTLTRGKNVYDESFKAYIYNDKMSLKIVAPVKDFANIQGYKMNVVNNEVIYVKDDPIVLKPVVFKSKLFFLVITAWGLEASDELIKNSIHN